MPDYQKMYYVLCDAISKVLDEAQGGAVPEDGWFHQLKAALNKAEDIYIDTAEDVDET